MKNKLPMLEAKTIEKYYLDGEEITESEYQAIKKFIKCCCSRCSQAKAQENLPLEQYSGGSSYHC